MPLHLCARFSRADAAKRLLDNRAQLGRTPLHLAVAADARDVVKVILHARAFLRVCAGVYSVLVFNLCYSLSLDFV